MGKSLDERIYEKIVIDGDCWRWKGGCKKGVPYIYLKENRVKIRQYLTGVVGHLKTICVTDDCVKPQHLVRGSRRKEKYDLYKAFYSKIKLIDRCLIWQGCKDGDGFGVFAVNNKNQRAHRFIYGLNDSPLDKNQIVIFMCERRDCLNTRHHKIVSKADISRLRSGSKLRGRKSIYTSEFISLAKDLSLRNCVVCGLPLDKPRTDRKYALCLQHSGNLSAALWYQRHAYNQKIEFLSGDK